MHWINYHTYLPYYHTAYILFKYKILGFKQTDLNNYLKNRIWKAPLWFLFWFLLELMIRFVTVNKTIFGKSMMTVYFEFQVSSVS